MVEHPNLTYRACNARMRVWFPGDRTNRRAIVMFTGYHNHPAPMPTKVSHDAQDKWLESVESIGLLGATRVKVERGTA